MSGAEMIGGFLFFLVIIMAAFTKPGGMTGRNVFERTCIRIVCYLIGAKPNF